MVFQSCGKLACNKLIGTEEIAVDQTDFFFGMTNLFPFTVVLKNDFAEARHPLI